MRAPLHPLDDFIDKFKTKFLPALEERLKTLPGKEGSKIASVEQSNFGIDVVLEDARGVTETYCVDPHSRTWIKVM